VAAVVARYGCEWFSQALDEVEERNRRPGNKPVYRRSFVQIKLEGWAASGGPPRRPEPAPAQPTKKAAEPAGAPPDRHRPPDRRWPAGRIGERPRRRVGAASP